MRPAAETERVARLCGAPASCVTFDGVGESGVERWRVTLDGSECRCRIHKDSRRFVAETGAYARMAAAGVSIVPKVVREVPEERALVLTHIPGVPATAKNVSVDGLIAVIDALHAVPVDHDPVPFSAAHVQRAEAVASALMRLRERSAAMTVLAMSPVDDTPRVFCHRDLGLRNLLVHNGALAVIDFEHAQADAPEFDLLRLELDVPEIALQLQEHYFPDGGSRSRWLALRVLERGRELAWAIKRRDWARAASARAFFDAL